MTSSKGKSRFTSQKPVLSDHKCVGKKLIPPLLHDINYAWISWMDTILPELLWLSLLNAHYGYLRGAELAIALSRATTEVSKKDGLNTCFSTVSSYAQLTVDQKEEIVEQLKEESLIEEYQIAFLVFSCCYPDCPLNFLFSDAPDQKEIDDVMLQEFKRVLENLFDRRGVEATYMQADAIYIAFITDKLKVFSNFVFADFSKIEEYPNTNRSREVAAGVRATINAFLGSEIWGSSSSWPQYFWNRGLELEPCDLVWLIEDG